MKTKRQKIKYGGDLFCGAGGTSTGMLNAMRELGYNPDLIAINHWEVAIATHAANHPDVRHRCESIDGADPRELVPGGFLDLLWASPECTGHSNARGGKPTNEQSRATAWHILRWAEALDIRNILIENVREFRDWGPLHLECTCGAGTDAKKHIKPCKFGTPVKEKKGKYYRNFLHNLRVLGYQVSERLLNAADYGDATSRTRLIIQARKGKRCVWPEPTHLKSDDLELYPGAEKWRSAREIIDWKLQGQSVYGRKKDLAPNTMSRIMAGLVKFSGLPFIVPQFSEHTPKSVDDPLGTITTTSRGVGLCEPYLVNMKGKSNACDIDLPMPTSQSHIYLTQPFIVPQFGEREGQSPRTHSIDDPLPTVTSHGAGALVQPFIIGAGGPSGQAGPESVDEPLGTVLTENHRCLVNPFFVKYYEGSDAASIDDPLPTITANYEHIGLVQPFLVVLRKNIDATSLDDPLRTLTTGGNMGLAQPFVIPLTHSGGPNRSHDIDTPLPTITTAKRGELGLIEPKLIAADPYLIKYHGNHKGKKDGNKRVHSVDEPLPTLDTSNRIGVARPFLLKYNSTGGARSTEEPLDTLTAKDRYALVSPEWVHLFDKGDIVGYLDIRFRMLQPHELAAAMGFPTDYKFTGNREAQVRQIGNAVPVGLATALCKAVLK